MEEQTIDNDKLEKLREIIYELTGNYYPKERLILLSKKLSTYLEKTKTQNLELRIEEFLKTKNFLKEMLDIITVPETKFFREKIQLDTFMKNIIYNMKPPIKLASFACSTGQEPYTLAMMLEKANIPYKIFGFDINENYLQKAKIGKYPKRELIDIPEDYKKFLDIHQECIEIKQILKEKVEFKQLNLIKQEDFAPYTQTFDVALCRNALIYFDNESKSRAIKNITLTMKTGGYFIISMTEVLGHIHTTAFETIKIENIFFYKKK